MKLFSIGVKELYERLVLRKKKDGGLLFLKAFSWETDPTIMYIIHVVLGLCFIVYYTVLASWLRPGA